MSKLRIIKKPAIQKIKGIIIKDTGFNFIIKKKIQKYDMKHKTYIDKFKKLTIKKKSDSLLSVGDSIVVVSCRKYSPTIFFKEA